MASKTFGIDFGTSTIKVYKKNEGIILDERNIIAVANKKQVIAVGDEAYEMYEKAPKNIQVTYPIRNGVIANFNCMVDLLNEVNDQIGGKSSRFGAAEYIVATPTDITEVEKRAFFDLITSSNAKARKVRIVEKPIADALGVDLDVTSAHGVMIVNIGADTTEVSVLALGGIVLSKLIPVGGNKLDESIKTYVKKKYNLIIGDKTAETIKKELASAVPCEESEVSVYGRDVVTGLPLEMKVSSSMVYEAISEYLYSIVDAIRIILERTPPEISSDIIDSGIYVTGGSANIRNLDALIAKETDLKINIAANASNSVVIGLGKIVEDPNFNSLAAPLRQNYFVG